MCQKKRIFFGCVNSAPPQAWNRPIPYGGNEYPPAKADDFLHDVPLVDVPPLSANVGD